MPILGLNPQEFEMKHTFGQKKHSNQKVKHQTFSSIHDDEDTPLLINMGPSQRFFSDVPPLTTVITTNDHSPQKLETLFKGLNLRLMASQDPSVFLDTVVKREFKAYLQKL